MSLLEESHVFAGLKRQAYKCVLLDPPTRFVAGTKGRPQHYKRMNDADIAALPVADLLHPDGAFIFLWVTSPKFYANPGSKTQLSPDAMVRPWGARYSGRMFEWIKLKKHLEACDFDYHEIVTNEIITTGMGYTSRKNAEDCLLFKTGTPKRLAKDIHEVIFAPRREHSRKPDEAIERIERFCAGPRLELFARESRKNWDTWGLEKTMFDMPQEIAA